MIFSVKRLPKFKIGICFLIIVSIETNTIKAQNIETKVIAYNVLVGGVSGGIGALINKKSDQKWHKAFIKGFIIGLGGGAIAYSGKKLNYYVSQNQNLGYCWLSRAVFSAGNSIVENAAANRPFWSQWHYDIGFVRLELKTNGSFTFIPKLMPSTLGGIIFMGSFGKFDLATSLRSGTVTFRTNRIEYASQLVASTASNGFLFVDSLRKGKVFYDTYAHEMVHAFQFQEFSGCNNFFIPLTDKWKSKSAFYKKASKWIYGDINYELMLFNYFIIQKGYRNNQTSYCKNYLENEAEFLSIKRSACYMP